MGRQLAVFTAYSVLVEALRARAIELNVSRQEIDALSGLQAGYASKLLGPVPIKKLGMTSLEPMLQALGVRLVLEIDEDSEARLTGRMPKRKHKMPTLPEHEIVEIRFTRRNARKFGRIGAKKRNERLSAKRRSKLARRAARSRWRRERAKARAARDLSTCNATLAGRAQGTCGGV